MLCNTLIVLVVVLWATGGHITYNALVVTRKVRPRRSTYVVTQIVWPFTVLYVGIK